jgi:hypothetical protein
MVVAPDSLEHPPSPALPTSPPPTSLGHESAMEATSDLPNTRLDETQAPDSPSPEKEKQPEGPPPTSSPVHFIGINYVPSGSRDVQTTSHPRTLHPTPWESGTASPISEDYVVIGLSTFPPKPYVVFLFIFTCPPTPFHSIPVLFSTHSGVQQRAASEAWRRAGFVVPVWAADTRFDVHCATYGTDWGTSPTRDCARGTRLHGGRDCAIFICFSHGV